MVLNKSLKLINKFSKFQIPNQSTKSVAFLYSNKELSEKAISFTMSPIRIKYLEMNLIKKVKDLSTGNCKILIKEVECTNQWKDIPNS